MRQLMVVHQYIWPSLMIMSANMIMRANLLHRGTFIAAQFRAVHIDLLPLLCMLALLSLLVKRIQTSREMYTHRLNRCIVCHRFLRATFCPAHLPLPHISWSDDPLGRPVGNQSPHWLPCTLPCPLIDCYGLLLIPQLRSATRATNYIALSQPPESLSQSLLLLYSLKFLLTVQVDLSSRNQR